MLYLRIRRPKFADVSYRGIYQSGEYDDRRAYYEPPPAEQYVEYDEPEWYA